MLLILLQFYVVFNLFNSRYCGISKTKVNKYAFDLNNINDDDSDAAQSVRDHIESIIDACLIKKSAGQIDVRINPKVLTDSAHFLSKGLIYEEIIKKKIGASTSSLETMALEKVDKTLGSFVQTERKNRARLKLNYILAGVSTNRLDNALELLVESEEIDDVLMSFIDTLIDKELLRGSGPTSGLSSASGNSEGSEKDEIKALSTLNKNALQVLQSVKKRLQAELKLKDRQDLKVISKLLAVDSPEIREKILRQSIQRIEDIEDLESMLIESINFVSTQSGAEESTLLARLRDLSWLVSQIRTSLITGIKDDKTLFSTSAEDYIP